MAIKALNQSHVQRNYLRAAQIELGVFQHQMIQPNSTRYVKGKGTQDSQDGIIHTTNSFFIHTTDSFVCSSPWQVGLLRGGD